MIIHGTRTFKRRKGTSNDLIVCNQCGLQTHFELQHFWRWFTLFFIPIFPYWVTRVIICPHCECRVKVKKHNEYEILNDIGNYLKHNSPTPVRNGRTKIAAPPKQDGFCPQPISVDSEELSRLSQMREKNAKYQGCIAAGSFHTIGLKTDGTIVADGDKKQCRLIVDWHDIVMVTAGSFHSVGLKSDGTVVTSGGDKYTLEDINTWSNIIFIATADNATAGLKADGTVVAVGYNDGGGCENNDWREIVSVATSGNHTVGLKSDGTVVASGKNKNGQCNTEKWTDVVAVAAGDKYTIGLRADGTMIAAGKIVDDMRDIANWRDIVAISADSNNIVGLKADGTVEFATDVHLYGLKNVADWHDIVAVSTAARHIVGLKADGKVVAVGVKGDGCNTDYWRYIGPKRFR